MRLIFFILLVAQLSCSAQTSSPRILTGAEQLDSEVIPLLLNKKVGVIANHTTTIGTTHLVDTLISKGIAVKKVFAPEHGFRGNVGAGDKVLDGIDAKTGLPLISLYGKNKKPTPEMLQGLDVVLFDIQDVGARFYTYISTMYYAMEACAEQSIPLIILDRPNPNGFYVDGPVLEKEFTSFVGVIPIPVVHGCTVGELAQMINGEKWLKNGIQASIKVVPCKNYSHKDKYVLPIPPSPNLPNMNAVYAYPSLCFFEGTSISVGRGTPFPFQSFGYPNATHGSYTFTPVDIPGVVQNPPFEGETCRGHLVNEFSEFWFTNHKQLYLEWLVGTYSEFPSKDSFFLPSDFFDKLAGSKKLRVWLTEGKDASEIRALYSEELKRYMSIRAKYLLYADFK